MEIDEKSQPLTVFNEWINEAKAHAHVREATAMSIATQGQDGSIHARVVLCKQWSTEGFVFFTNYNSRKGLDLDRNPNVGAVFYWDALFRQVKISGKAAKTSRQVSEAYWNSRARESQLSQYISRQSEEAPSRVEIEKAWSEADKKFLNKPIPCPLHWGGYLIAPELIEFWVGRPGRLHDRYEFEKHLDRWTFRRLYP